jgi:hypothetical protein
MMFGILRVSTPNRDDAMLLDFFGGVLLTAAVVFNVNAIVSAIAIGRAAKLVLTAVAGLWIGLQVSLAMAGAFTSQFAATFPLIGLMVAAPIAAVAIAAAASPSARSVLLELSMPMLVGLNAGRIFGAFFLFLAADGRLGGPFPQSAGWGDIITGAVALPLAFYAMRPWARSAVFWWNVFGIADLIVAVTLGTLSFNGFVLQAIEAGAGSDAVQRLPWSLIPTVLVPFYLITHGIIFAQLRRERLVGSISS